MAEEQIGIDIVINAAESANSVAELKKSITDLQDAAIAAGNSGDDALANKYIAAAGAARDKIGDLNDAINATKGAADKLGAITNIGQSIAGGFAAAQGAAALFGASQEDVQQQLLKVQAATALLSGIQSAANIKEQLEVASIIAQQTVRTVQTNLQTAAEEGGIVVRIAATAAQKALNLAMNNFPALLIIAGITSLIAALNSLGDTAEETAEKQIKLNNEVAASAKHSYDLQIGIAQALGKNTKDLEIEREEANKKRIYNEATTLLEIGRMNGEFTEEQIKRREELEKEFEESTDRIAILRAEKQKQEIDDEKKHLDELKQQRKEAADDRLKAREEEEKERERLATIEFEAIVAEWDREKERAIERENEKKEAADREYQEQLDSLAREQEAQAVMDQYEIQHAAWLKSLKEKELAEERARTQAKISLAESSLKGATALAQIIFKDSEKLAKFNKDAALIQIGIDTAKAISGVVAAASATSITPIDLAAKIAAGAAVVLANIAKAKQLLDTKGATAPSLAGGAPPTATIPAFKPAASPTGTVPTLDRPAPSPRTSSTGQPANAPQIPNQEKCDCGPKVGSGSTQLDEEGRPMEIRAYVVESEVTKKQNNIKQIKERNTF